MEQGIEYARKDTKDLNLEEIQTKFLSVVMFLMGNPLVKLFVPKNIPIDNMLKLIPELIYEASLSDRGMEILKETKIYDYIKSK